MIRIENLNKYFNHHRKNEIHVINNTSLTIEKTGLVALLGSSGSGKTTLLNTIGGLDKVKSGNIYINNQKITSKFSYKVDKIRNLNIGYIFQDYKLVDNLSVYDNVALVLKMIGIKDKKEIDKRVSYVLERVGMYRYRKRPASMLSGGERQRVGIARAIVKNPNIIIADEPTGNLDSKNSLEIMNIIKAIAKDRLVILVTHEVNLAKFYATRIIEITDGKIIKDYENSHNDELDYAIDNRFYLKDFKNEKNVTNDTCNLNIYSDNNAKLVLDIIVKNNNIYIRSSDNKKIEVIDENSNIEIVNDHYKKMNQKDILKYQFNFKDIIDDSIKPKYSSIFNPFTFITNGFKKVFDYPIIKKILLVGFFLSGFFIMFATSRIAANLKIEDKDFVKVNSNYLSIETNKIKIDDYLKYKSEANINYIIPTDSLINLGIKVDDFYQTSRQNVNIEGSLSSIKMINDKDLIKGVFPTNNNEIVVDKLTVDNLLSKEVSKMIGLEDRDDILNRIIEIPNLKDFKIVGIVDLGSPSIYVDESNFINILYNTSASSEDINTNQANIDSIFDYTLVSDKITIKEGKLPENDYEVIVNYDNKEEMKLNKEINQEINNHKLKVVGYYESADQVNNYYVNQEMILYKLLEKSKNITIYPENKELVLNTFRDKYGVNIKDSYESDRDKYISGRADATKIAITSSLVILAISFIEIILMLRSSFLSRVKEVGIYRAIGVKKIDIYTMFSGEIIAITTLTSIPGIILAAYIINTLSTIPLVSKEFLVNPFILLITVVCIYIFNLIVGLLPVCNTIRKRPAEILSRTDL